ncbi:hypothetical protein D3C80_592160 [compost metagenome]
MRHHPDLAALRRLRNHLRKRRDHIRVQACFWFVQCYQRRQTIRQKRACKREQTYLSVGQLARTKNARRKGRKVEAECCRFFGIWNDELCTFQGIGNQTIKIDRILTDMRKRRKD